MINSFNFGQKEKKEKEVTEERSKTIDKNENDEKSSETLIEQKLLKDQIEYNQKVIGSLNFVVNS